MKSSVQNIVVFDLETTGLSHEKNCLIEIACCPLNIELQELPEFHSGIMNVYDNREITDGALNANGITRDQIARGRDPKQVLEDLCKYFESLKVGRNLPVLCGHNIDKFDIPFLDNYFSFFKKDLSKYVNFDLTIDTMWWARLMWVEQENYKLGTCCSSAKIELVNAHRAIADTRANRSLVKYFLQNMRSESGSSNPKTRYRATFQF